MSTPDRGGRRGRDGIAGAVGLGEGPLQGDMSDRRTMVPWRGQSRNIGKYVSPYCAATPFGVRRSEGGCVPLPSTRATAWAPEIRRWHPAAPNAGTSSTVWVRHREDARIGLADRLVFAVPRASAVSWRSFCGVVRPFEQSSNTRQGSSAPFEFVRMVRVKGLEPPRLAAPEPKSGASTSSATPAHSGI